MKATTTLLSLLLWHGTLATATAPNSGGRLGDDDNAYQLTLTRLMSAYEPAQDDGRDVRFSPVEALRDALDVMQSTWFELWVGQWPTAIDWTAAVLDTYLVSSLRTLSKALKSPQGAVPDRDVENDINRYFSQNVAYYFGEDAFSIRNQAYDDILWVVLGWLESVKFIQGHSRRHYCPTDSGDVYLKPWQGTQFIQAFSHRARIFYDLASNGWDDSLCGGGMVWSPYLGPYKNAITNQLYISASIGMYLYFTGDNNTLPFVSGGIRSPGYDAAEPQDPKYLRAARKGYDWLKSSNMQNDLGLYVDGFHVHNWRHGGTVCNIRNEMVFTYNQGVILSGLRGLWEGTGNTTYLKDAHQLARNVVKATGWDLDSSKPVRKHWSGLGRGGILEESCDASGLCSQDAQTFKGIFFHHLTLLCEPLPLEPLIPGKTFAADRTLAALHRQSCREYTTWVAHNARAAVNTKDKDGKLGMWWGAREDADEAPLPLGAIDYRNNGSELEEELWQGERSSMQQWDKDNVAAHYFRDRWQVPTDCAQRRDLNDRGRGRTVETQGGGVAVLTALWELLHMKG